MSEQKAEKTLPEWRIDYRIVTTEHGIKFTEPICRCENCGAIATTVKLQCSHCKGQKNDFKVKKEIKKSKERKKMENMFGKKVIVRGDRSGVFFGTLAQKDGREVTLEKCRRIWYWDGAASISQLATDGTTCPDSCKFTVTVDTIAILDAIEIILCSTEAIASIEGVSEWKR